VEEDHRRKPYSLWGCPAFFLAGVVCLSIGFHTEEGGLVGEPIRVSVPVLSVGQSHGGRLSQNADRRAACAQDLPRAERAPWVSFSSRLRASGTGSRSSPGLSRAGNEGCQHRRRGHAAWKPRKSWLERGVSGGRVQMAGGEAAGDSGVIDMIILDDGFQHFKSGAPTRISSPTTPAQAAHAQAVPVRHAAASRSRPGAADIIIVTRASWRPISAHSNGSSAYSVQSQPLSCRIPGGRHRGTDQRLP